MEFYTLKHSHIIESHHHFLALMLAAMQGHCEVLALLLSKGADPLTQDSRGMTALMLAVLANQLTCTQHLLQHHQVNEMLELCEHNGNTALMLAASAGCVDIASALVLQGANFTATNRHGQTALTLATARNHTELATALQELL